jgi:hypothetical protein
MARGEKWKGKNMAQTTLEHREAFIQDLAGLKWHTAVGGHGWSTYCAPCDGHLYVIRVFPIGIDRKRPDIVLATTEDEDFRFYLALSEAKRILGKAWKEA